MLSGSDDIIVAAARQYDDIVSKEKCFGQNGMRMISIVSTISLTTLWLLLCGFTLSPTLIPAEQILSGGPPKDGIPALTYPKMETAEAAGNWLNDNDLILGIVIDGKARAYPIRILNWHEIVNDRIGQHAFVLSYCPLCGSGMAFDSNDLFGVSGLLYQSDVLLYDKKTESLWSQLMMQAVAGSRTGEKLQLIPIEHSTWSDWKTAHPNTSVLSRHTGYHRDYSRNPYAGYEDVSGTYFPIYNHDERLPSKAWVIGLSMGNQHIAWKLDDLKKHGSHQITWKQHRLAISVHGEGVQIRDTDSDKLLVVTRLYWFAWVAFHPDTDIAPITIKNTL